LSTCRNRRDKVFLSIAWICLYSITTWYWPLWPILSSFLFFVSLQVFLKPLAFSVLFCSTTYWSIHQYHVFIVGSPKFKFGTFPWKLLPQLILEMGLDVGFIGSFSSHAHTGSFPIITSTGTTRCTFGL
jgi:hypothetical protein